jgi:N utilization substance protein B
MLNRRHIRIKVLQILFAYYNEDKPDAARYEKMLFESIERFRELYISLMGILVEMHHLAIEKIEMGMQKRLPSHEDLHPNTRFVTNELLRILAHSKNLESGMKYNHLKWNSNPELVKKLFRGLLENEDYLEYMNGTERGFEYDRELVLRIFKKFIVNHEDVQDFMEDQGIFWNDDLDLAASMVLRTLKSIKSGDDEIQFLPLWKEGDDEEGYCRDLFRKTLAMGADLEKSISEYTKNWEIERIAVMDVVIMKMALTEALIFDQIPIKVTMNEYIELAKYYSTPKSAQFVNGLLDQIIPKWKTEGKIKKVGRGLIE